MKLIAGIDPGMITGVAVADIESDFYRTASSRNFSFSEICDYLVALGEPVVVAVDTMHIPDAVKRVAAAFGARIYAPRRDLYIGEKRKITQERNVRNDHERDSLAAAMHAKSFFAPLFSKIDSSLDERSLKRLSPEVKELLIKNEAGNIEQAVKFLLGEARPGIKIVPRLIEAKKVMELRKAVDRLRREKDVLQKKMDGIERENAALKQPVKIDEPAAMRNLRRSLAVVVSEKKEIEEEYALYKELAERYDIVTDIPKRGGVVIFKDGTDIRRLESVGPRAIISDKFLKTSVPIVHPGRVRLQKIGKFLVVEKDELARALGSESFIEWLAQYKEMRKNEAE